MSHNVVDFAAAFKVSKPDNRSKIFGFQFERENNKLSFRDSLREALKSGRHEKKEANEAAVAGKKIINRPEVKPNSLKNPESEAPEASEKQTEKLEKKANKILTLLEEWAKLPQTAEMPEGMHAPLPDSIKDALMELSEDFGKSIVVEASSLKAGTEELKALLEGLLEQLRISGGLMKKEDAADFARQLYLVITDDANASDITQEQQVSETTEASGDKSYWKAEAEAEKGKPVFIHENIESMKAEKKITSEAAANDRQGIRIETPAVSNGPDNKESKPSIEENPDDVKKALDGKIEKADASGREYNKQDAEAGSIREAVMDISKKVPAAPDRQGNAEAAAINPDQAATGNKAENLHNQAAAKPSPVNKAEIIQQIVKKAEVVLKDTQSEMRMQLEPEKLGKLTLKLTVEKGLITAKFVTESYQVKQIIESSFNELRDMLQEKGLEVQNFSVSVGQENKEYSSNLFQHWNDTVRLNARSMNRGSYEGYPETEGTLAIAANPYSVHNGKFDQRA